MKREESFLSFEKNLVLIQWHSFWKMQKNRGVPKELFNALTLRKTEKEIERDREGSKETEKEIERD